MWLTINDMHCVCSSTQANKYTQQELLLMKTQDVKYVELKSRTEAKVCRWCVSQHSTAALHLPQ